MGNLVSKSETPELYDTENVSLDIRNAIDSTKTGFIQVEITIKDQQETTVYEEQSQSATIDTGYYTEKRWSVRRSKINTRIILESM